jgi:glycerol-3-phosphate acyltransferase PlsX
MSRRVIAVDAMGGDRAPDAVIDGAIQAARAFDVDVALAGPASVLQDHLARRGLAGAAGLSIIDAPDVVGMGEPPLAAYRRKPKSSIRVAADLVEAGGAQALFTAGHSGVAFLAAHAAFGVLPGVERPALAVTMPTETGAAVLLDAGANVECRAEHLAQFGVMGAAYARIVLQVDQPRVGLLSIGEEAGKGTDLVRDAHALLTGLPLNFIGNLEARDLFTGRADVVVCDGFTGNIALKVGEGLAEALEQMLREELGGALVSQIGALLTRRAFARLRQRVDAAEYGAAPLLGVRALTLVGHGRSTPRAVESAIGTAVRLLDARVVGRLGEAMGHG